jgi:DNA-binding NarL/FixJ family response regulator
MFRLLADVYARLGVTSRTGALMRAREEGWL